MEIVQFYDVKFRSVAVAPKYGDQAINPGSASTHSINQIKIAYGRKESERNAAGNVGSRTAGLDGAPWCERSERASERAAGRGGGGHQGSWPKLAVAAVCVSVCVPDSLAFSLLNKCSNFPFRAEPQRVV